MSVRVVRGTVETSALSYKLATDQTLAKGDLIRIGSDGLIAIALTSASAAGAVHGIALKNGATTAVAATETVGAGELFPVALFNNETVIAIPLPAATDFDALGTTGLGLLCTLTVTTQANAIIDATSNGILRIVGVPSDDQWFDTDNVSDTKDGGDVYVTVPTTVLEGRSA